MPSELSYFGYTFRPLSDCDLAAYGRALDYPDIREHITYYEADDVEGHLREQLAQPQDFMLGIEDALGPCGWTGVFDECEGHDGLETGTFLAPRARGAGLNAATKQVLWAIAQILGRELYISIEHGNDRSLAAVRRMWPELHGELHETSYAPPSTLYHITHPPLVSVAALSEHQLAVLAAMLDGYCAAA